MHIRSAQQKILGLLITIVIFFGGTTMASTLTRTGSAPADNGWINANSFTAQLDIRENNLDQFKRTRGGTEYNIYDSGLVLMVNFDNLSTLGESEGTSIKDFSMYGKSLLFEGTNTWTNNGKRGGAYLFGNNRIYLNPTNPLSFANQVTVSVWIKPNRLNDQDRIFADGDDLTLYVNTSKIRPYIANLTVKQITTNATIKTGVWSHIACTYDKNGGTNNYKFYYNGVLDSQTTSANTISNPGNIVIGTYQNNLGGTYQFSGIIDEFRMYNRALSAQEISILYQSNIAKYDTGKRLFSFTPTWTANGIYRYTGYVSDGSGNTTITGRNVSWIRPRVTYYYTGNNGLAILTGYSGLTIINNSGNSTYSFSGNETTFRFIVQDSYGISGIVNSVLRNNDYFIDTNFWNGSPSSLDIINALYGDGTGLADRSAYTRYRNTITCVTGNMNVIYITGGGIDRIPTTLTANNIYVISGGTYSQSGTINIVNCSAIVGQGDVVIVGTTTTANIIGASNQRNRILDNVKLFKYTNSGSPYGIYGNGMTSLTVNNIEVSGAIANAGIYYQLTNYSLINNAKIHNNRYGVQYYASPSDYNLLTNSEIFNNSSDGITLTSATGNIIDNCQIYNNGTYGIYYYQNSQKNVLNNSQVYNNTNGIYYAGTNPGSNIINNSQIYNNTNYGINYTSGSNNIINNTWIYNNGTTGIYLATISLTNKYYGTNNIFGNTTNIGGTTTNLATGSSSDFPSLGRTDGIIDQSTILSRDYISNPKNNVDNYLSTRSDVFSSIRGNKTFPPTTGITYSYGSGILLQKQAVGYFTGSTITQRFTPVTTSYIGGFIDMITGAIIGTWGTYTPTSITITGITNSPATKYNIFGDLTSFLYGVDNNTSTGFTFSDQLTTNRIVMQMYDPTNYFATHFQVSTPTITYTYPSTGVTIATLTGYNGYTIINNGGSNTYTLSGTDATGANLRRAFQVEDNNGNISNISTWLRNNDSAINSNFWSFTPNNREIFSALFGDGSVGGDKTFYTQNRASNTCSTGNLTRTNLSPGTDQLPITLVANTIYILDAGTYLTTATRNLGTCTAIIGKGTVTIQGAFATATRLLSSSTKQNRILDNLRLNRNYTGSSSSDVIYIATTSSTTINNVDIYGGYIGIYYYTTDLYNTLSNSQTHNNANIGMVIVNNSSGNIINNVKSYSNTSYGMSVTTNSHNNTINNSQSYNNTIGIIVSTSDGTIISNSQSYNNSQVGLRASKKITLNNSQVYNNSSYGIEFQAGADYAIINNSQSYNNAYGFQILAPYVSINNTQIYNNDTAGLRYHTAANSGVINNSQIYNNGSYGIEYSIGTNNAINNSQIYNNGTRGITLAAVATNNKYYGTIKMFGNGTDIGGTTTNFITGSSSDFPGLGRNNGSIDTSPILSRDYMTNPLNASGTYLLNWSGTFTTFRNKLTYTGIEPMGYSYGSGILLQTQPVLYSGTTLINSGAYTGINYIGSNATKYTGTLDGIGTYNGTNSTFTGISNSPITTYNLFGDIQPFIYNIPINTSTGVIFSGGISTGKIITQIYNPADYFATHFQNITTIDTVGPSTPTLISPTDGQTIPTSGVSLVRSAAIDTGVGIGGYIYQVSTTTGFTSFVISGDKTTTGVSLINFANGTYYRRVYSYDLGGITGGRSNTRGFTVNIITAPIVSTGYISAGTTGDNGGTNYYKGTINIKASLSGQSITSCEYNIGGGRIVANTGIDYCEATGLNPGTDITIQFRATNPAGTTTGGITTYILDNTPPTTVTLLTPIDGTGLDTNLVNFSRSGANDTGIGISGYFYEISNDIGFSNIVSSGQQNATSILTTLPDDTYYRKIYAIDNFDNTGSRSNSFHFTITTMSAPIVGTGYISAGTTGVNGGTNYYKGTINIKASLSGQSITSCEYNIGGGRVLANTGADYCEATNLNPGTDITVQFRATNAAGTTTGGATTYLYDNTGPTQVPLLSPSIGSGVHTNQVNLSRSGANDTGIGVSGYIYEIGDDMGTINLHSGTTQTNILLNGLVDGTYTRRVSAVDKLNNAGARSASRTFEITTAFPPTVGTGYISAGTTGANGGTNYYKGTINIKATMTGTNITSCEYTLNGTTRLTASTGIDYCEMTSLTPVADIHVQFRATNPAGTTTGGITNYLYDATGPSTPTAISPSSGTYINNAQIHLLRSAATDTGSGIGGYYYEVKDGGGLVVANGTSTTTSADIFGLTDGLYTWRVYAYDKVLTTGSRSNTANFGYTFSFDLSFPGISNQSLGQKFSPVHFAAPGNNFVGGIFRLTTKSLTGNETIMIAGDPAERNCNKQVRGIYFNSQRGKRVWPLDQYTLALLQQTSNTYDNLQMSGGLFTSCTGYNYSIYGQVSYNQSGTISSIVAGTNLDYMQNLYGFNGIVSFADSLQYFDNKTPIGYIRDSFGGIGFVGGTMTGSADLITYLNNGGTINKAFEQTGTNITSITGNRRFTSNTTGDNASNTIWNLLVQGSVGLSQSMDAQDRISLLGNPQDKTIILGTENINNATLINQAKQNMERLCKGKTWSNATSLSVSNDTVLCFENTHLSIKLDIDEPLYRGKTIIMRSGDIEMKNSMESSYGGLDIFIDQGNLYLENNATNLQSFDNQGYAGGSPAINSGTLLRGNIIINGLIIGGMPSHESGYNHKLYIQGKISSLNTPFAPTQARKDFIADVLGTNYDNRIGLQSVFVWTCLLNGIGTDGTACSDASEMSSIPLVIVDGKYSSRLLDQ